MINNIDFLKDFNFRKLKSSGGVVFIHDMGDTSIWRRGNDNGNQKGGFITSKQILQ